MAESWTEPVYVLVSRMPATLIGLWSLLQTGAVAASELALLPGLDDDLSLTLTSADLQEAARELEWAQPRLPSSGLVLKVGTAPLNDVQGCRAAIAALIEAASRAAIGVLGQSEASTADLLAVVRLLPSLSAAQLRMIGRQP